MKSQLNKQLIKCSEGLVLKALGRNEEQGVQKKISNIMQIHNVLVPGLWKCEYPIPIIT